MKEKNKEFKLHTIHNMIVGKIMKQKIILEDHKEYYQLSRFEKINFKAF